jgi:hypothetical protein
MIIKTQTRRNIADAFVLHGIKWSGRLNEEDFLLRLFPSLKNMHSNDKRCISAYGDISCHRTRYVDWENDWVFTDNRFDLLHIADEIFIKFLCEMLHPAVRPDEKDLSDIGEKTTEILDILNFYLKDENLKITPKKQEIGKPIFQMVKNEDLSSTLLNDAEIHKITIKKLITMDKVEHDGSSVIQKIFISHSSKDKKIVEHFIELLEFIGLSNKQIFCTSFEGYGIEYGEDFLDRIRQELDEKVLVIFLLSHNFYESPVCLCEMGAVWVKSNTRIPIIIPPFDFKDIKGVFPTTQGLKIINHIALTTLKRQIERLFALKELDFSTWELRRNNIINRILEEITKNQEIQSANTNKHAEIRRSSFY